MEIFFVKHYSKSRVIISMDKVFSNLLTKDTIGAAFPNLVTLASLAIVLPVTTATVERSFSDMKLIKTRLRNRLGEESLDQTMRICIEGPDTLNAVADPGSPIWWCSDRVRILTTPT